MQAVSHATQHVKRRCLTLTSGLAVAVAAFFVSIPTLAAAEFDCPWEVHKLSRHYLPKRFGPNTQAFKFIYFGADSSSSVFYGFSLAVDTVIPDLGDLDQLANLDARSLQPIPNERRPKAYVLTGDADVPATIYLVTANAEIPPLEERNVRIQPRPPRVKRGPNDHHGPLPSQALPIEPVTSHLVSSTIRLQVCAGLIESDDTNYELYR